MKFNSLVVILILTFVATTIAGACEDTADDKRCLNAPLNGAECQNDGRQRRLCKSEEGEIISEKCWCRCEGTGYHGTFC